MKMKPMVATFMVVGFALMPMASAAEIPTPNALIPVSVFTAKDFPEPEPGKPAWLPGGTWSYGIAYYDKWVYAASQAEYILQFERDPVTAKLTYKGATAFTFHSEEKNSDSLCQVRLLDDGQAMLTIQHGGHQTGLLWYAIDKDTGKLAAAGQQVPVAFKRGHAEPLWTPDRQRFYIGGDTYEKIDWYRFGADGAPVADGITTLKKHSVGNRHGMVRSSPDGRHMYCLVFQNSDKDPQNDKAPQIDLYEIDPKTHTGTYRSSLELPVFGTPQAHVIGALEPFSPDGKHLYVVFASGPNSCYYALARDSDTGTLTIAGQKTEPGLAASSLVNPDWYRVDRFAFAGDGRSGYFVANSAGGPLGSFTRNPETGALTVLTPVQDLGARKLVVDPVHGNLFTVGEQIASFKIPASAPAASAK